MEKYMEFSMQKSIEHEFVQFVRDMDGVLLSALSPVPEPKEVDGFFKRDENIFWKKIYIARKADLKSIGMIYINSCGHYIIEDTYKSPVIEIRKSGIEPLDNMVLWASFHYNSDTGMVYKGKDFEDLYKNIETWIKINCVVFEQNIQVKKLCSSSILHSK